MPRAKKRPPDGPTSVPDKPPVKTHRSCLLANAFHRLRSEFRPGDGWAGVHRLNAQMFDLLKQVHRSGIKVVSFAQACLGPCPASPVAAAEWHEVIVIAEQIANDRDLPFELPPLQRSF